MRLGKEGVNIQILARIEEHGLGKVKPAGVVEEMNKEHCGRRPNPQMGQAHVVNWIFRRPGWRA